MRILFFISFLMGQLFAVAQNNKPFHKWASTPPMGWNSWDCFGPTVVESEVKANADYMASHLKKYGWEYVVVDIRWFVANDKARGYNQKNPIYAMDSFCRFQPALNRFPSAENGKGFKPLADYIHAKGLKFGIHIMRGIPVIAVNQNLRIYHSKYTAQDVYNKNDLCKWLKDMYTVDATKPGAQAYYNSLMNMYASWGVDFIKVDDLSAPVYHADEIELIRKAIDQTGRKILLSTSPGETPINNTNHIQANANMWRTVDDFWDNWKQLKEHFEVFRRWNGARIQGGWPDGDMLPLGHIGIRAERGVDRRTLFTKDEQKTLVTLWAMFRSPMMFGGHLPDNDAFTDSLLTNAAILELLQKSSNNQEVFLDSTCSIWSADIASTGVKYIAIFNIEEPIGSQNDIQKRNIVLSTLGATKKYTITDNWQHNLKIVEHKGNLVVEVPKHGVTLLKLVPLKKN